MLLVFTIPRIEFQDQPTRDDANQARVRWNWIDNEQDTRYQYGSFGHRGERYVNRERNDGTEQEITTAGFGGHGRIESRPNIDLVSNCDKQQRRQCL